MVHWMNRSVQFSTSVRASSLAVRASSLLSKRRMRLADALATMIWMSAGAAGLDHALQGALWGL